MRGFTVEFPRLYTERLVLRVPGTTDVTALVRYVNDNAEFLAPWEPARTPAYYTAMNWHVQVQRFRDEFQRGHSLRLIMARHDTPETMIGLVNFSNLVRGVAQYCNLGYSLAESAQGQGYMTEALRAAIDYVFGPMNLHRIQANYMPHNRRSGAVLERLGFRIEGHASAYLRINGTWQDHVLTSLTNPAWEDEPL